MRTTKPRSVKNTRQTKDREHNKFGFTDIVLGSDI
jgi:hypothetical protein